MIRLQRCTDCGSAQYPPREFCGACLSGSVACEDAAGARVLARTVLHHSNEARFRARLPLVLGLVRFDAGPVAVCFLSAKAVVGETVQVRVGDDGLLEAA